MTDYKLYEQERIHFDFEQHYKTIERQVSECFPCKDFDVEQKIAIGTQQQSLFGTTNHSTPNKPDEFLSYYPSRADSLFDSPLFWTPPMDGFEARVPVQASHVQIFHQLEPARRRLFDDEDQVFIQPSV